MTACTGGTSCVMSMCQCTAPETDCGGTCYATQTDPNHCGAGCTQCTPPPANGAATCSSGTCGVSCNAGFSDCGGMTPCAFDTMNDRTHCGTGCAACSTGYSCSGGSCVCGPAPYQICNGTCTDTYTDDSNCGTCGTVCDTAGGYNCFRGACTCPDVHCGPTLNCGCNGSCCLMGTIKTCC
jgi:hypothetical protein